jgi:hypothetical protein
VAQRWRLTRTSDGETVTYPNFDGWRWFEDGLTPPDVSGKGWTWVLDSPPPPPAPPPPPTSQQLADQLDALSNSTERVVLGLRSLISLLADDKGISDAQAFAAVKNRAKQIVEGTRGQ